MKTLKSIASGSALAALSLSAGAYESDFHFGLTWWLARQTGFDLQQSQEIARNNELTDTGMLDAKHAMIWELCIWRNTCASKMTRAMHFRSKTPPPAEPSAREVTEGAVYAEAQSISIIKTPKHEEPKVQGWFGQALHGRQDAYSHAGKAIRSGHSAQLNGYGRIPSPRVVFWLTTPTRLSGIRTSALKQH